MEKGRFKVVGGISVATAAAVLAAAVSWVELDLPRPAWHSEVAALEVQVAAGVVALEAQVATNYTALEAQVAANTQLILGDKWLRLTAQITELEDQIAGNPPNKSKLIARLATLQLQLRAVNSELK